MCVCVCCPVGVRGWLVISFKSLSLLPAGGAFGRMKTGTLSCLQVKSYLSASTTGNNKYDLPMGISFNYQILSRVLVMAGALYTWMLLAWLLPSLGLGITAAVS